MPKDDGDFSDIYGLQRISEQLDEIIAQGKRINMDRLPDIVQRLFDAVTKIAMEVGKGKSTYSGKEAAEIFKRFAKEVLDEAGVVTSAGKKYVRSAERTLGSQEVVSDAKLYAFLQAFMSKGFTGGYFSADRKAAQNPLAQALAKEYMPQTIKGINSIRDAILHVWNEQKGGEKTKKRQFVEDLVEGLARSKFVGGALSDFIKLGALFIASWLKDKGTWGKVLAVGLVAAAPIIGAAIAGLVVKGITSLFTRTIGLIGKGVWGAVRWLGRTLLTAILGSKAFGGLAGALRGLGIGAKGVGTVSRAGMALAPGVAGLGMPLIATAEKEVVKRGVAGFVAKRAATAGASFAFGPVVGGIISVVSAIWILVDIVKALWNWWKNKKGIKGGGSPSPSGGGKGGNSSSSSSDVGLPNVQDTEKPDPKKEERRKSPVDKLNELYNTAEGSGEDISSMFSIKNSLFFRNKSQSNDKDKQKGKSATYGMLKIGKYGQVLNAGSLTQDQLAEGFRLYKEKDPDRFNRLYEVVPEGMASLASFETDAVMKDAQGRKIGAVMGKGSMDYLNSLRQHLISEGMHSSSANKLMFTSGMGTLGGPHSVGGAHYDPYGRGVDLVGIGWSQDIASWADPRIKSFTAKRGGKADWEYGKGQFGTPADGMSNGHWHEDLSGKASANAKSIRVEGAVMEGVKKAKDEIKDLTASASEQARAQWARINKEFKEDTEKQVIIPPDKQPLIDFPGTETCSKVLQNTINLQQQAYQQR